MIRNVALAMVTEVFTPVAARCKSIFDNAGIAAAIVERSSQTPDMTITRTNSATLVGGPYSGGQSHQRQPLF